MDDVRAVPATLSGRFSALRSTRNHHRLWGGAGTVSMAGDRESSRTTTVLAAHELGPA